MSDDERQAEPAPEGAHCAEHPERSALVTCPRCGSYACLGCWHNAVNRCHACLLRDPMPPVPWADPERAWPARLLSTLAGAFRPTSSAVGFARGEWTRAISFALITFLPLSLMSGIIPFTHHLLFGGRFHVSIAGDPTWAELAIDVAQAAGFGLLFALVKLVCLTVPYLSLTRAYGNQALESRPARQVMLYRAWLLPLGGINGLVLGLMYWTLPFDPTAGLGEGAMGILSAISLLPLLLLLWSMTATARVAGSGPLASMVVVIVPFLLMMFAEPMLVDALSPWLPDTEALRQAAEAAGGAP